MKPKHIIVVLWAAALSACLAAFLTGCQSTPVMVRPASTNMVEVVRTNWVQLVQTNTVNATNVVTQTNLVAAVTTNVITVVAPPVYYTNLSIAPVVETGVRAAGDVAPVPWGGPAGSVALGIAGTVLAFINDRRRKAALGQAQTWQSAAGVLVQNVEMVRKAALEIPQYKEIDAKVVRLMESSQRAAGIKTMVHDLVEQHTDDTLPTGPPV